MFDAVTVRAAILDLTTRQNGVYSDGDRELWLATFRYCDASCTRKWRAGYRSARVL